MPRLPIDYSKTIIYKICCNDVNIKEVYVGHTTDLIRRRIRHKESCNNEKSKEYNAYKYQYIRDNGGWSNWSLVPIELYKCENVNQARIKERYWIETLQAELNKLIPSRSKKEYRKEWYKSNENYNKEYQKNNKEKIKEQRKEYRMENNELIKKKKKEYYENNKEKLNESIKCECGGCYSFKSKQRHFKTKKHQEYLTTVINTSQESSP